MPRSRACLALGGNRGAVLATFRGALRALAAGGAPAVAVSAAYRTVAEVWPGAAPARPYWNCACEVITALPPRALWALCRRVERAVGIRAPSPRWAARRLDVDLLCYREVVLVTPALQLPHPRMAGRAFVLRPLVDLGAQRRLRPGGRGVAALLAALPDPDRGILARRRHWAAPVATPRSSGK